MIRAVAIFLLLAGCLPTASEYPNGWTSADEKSCLADGGAVVNGKAGPACAMPTPDAGATCSDGSTCAGGLCLATGQCVAQTQNFGCIDILEGGETRTLCID